MLNLSPVPRYDYRVGMPLCCRWREVLNTDSAFYGGSGVGNLGGVEAEAVPWHDQPFSAHADAAAARRRLARPRIVLLSLPNVGRPSDSCAVLSQPVGTVTLLFTDVEGSTRLLKRLGAADYARVLEQHRALLRDSFAKHEGYEFGTEGDAFFVAFAEAGSALAAAGEAQKALADAEWPDGVELRVRMGVHTGNPTPVASNYVGIDLHRVARIMSAGHGGQIVVSATTRALVDAKLTELGEHRLKDFDEPIALFQIDDDRFPPLKTISNTNLPRPASSLVGRERERDELVAMLQNGSRLVTLTGPGGSGKTGSQSRSPPTWFPPSVPACSGRICRRCAIRGSSTETLAQTLGAKTDLAEHICDRDLLLVLDNFEQVADAAAELGRLLEACPG